MLFRDTHVTIIDVASRTHRDLETPTPVAKLEVAGPIAYYVDPHGELWKLDLAGGMPSKIGVDEAIDSVAPSPDGRWVALAGAQHVLLIDRTTTLPPEVIADGTARQLTWQADSAQLAAITDEEVIAFALVPNPTIIHRYLTGAHFALALSRGRLLATGPTGVTWVQRDNPVPRASGLDYTLGLRVARGDLVVAGRPTGMSILTDEGDRTIISPVRLTRIETSPRGSFVVAASDDKLLVWDLDAVVPRGLGDDPVTAAAFVTGDQLVVTHVDTPAQWIDLRSGKTTELGPIAGIVQLAPAPDGHRAVVIDATHHGRVIAPTGEPIDLGDDLDLAAFVDDARLALATAAGTVKLGERVLVARAAPITALAVTGGTAGANAGAAWVAAAYADRVLWRMNLDTGTATTLVADPAPLRHALVVASDGTAVFGVGPELRAWGPAGTVQVLAHLGRPIDSVALLGEGHVLAIAHDGTALVAALDRLHPSDPVGVALPISNASVTATSGLVGALTSNGAIEVLDPSVGERWTIAQPRDTTLPNAVQSPRPFVRSVAIAPDGRRLLAITTGKLLVWPLALPATPATTVPWAEALTNATIARVPAGPLDWTL